MIHDAMEGLDRVRTFGISKVIDEGLKRKDDSASLYDIGIWDDLNETLRYFLTTKKNTYDGQFKLESSIYFLFGEDFDHEYLFSEFMLESPPMLNRTILYLMFDSTVTKEERKEMTNEIIAITDKLQFRHIKIDHFSSSMARESGTQLLRKLIIIISIFICSIISFLLFISFLKISFIILPICILLLTMVWSLGTYALLGFKIGTVSIILVPLLIGIGIDDLVHFARRYQEDLSKGQSPEISIIRTMKGVGIALFLTTLTTIIGFVSNVTSSLSPIRDFGFMATIGIFYAFLLTTVLQVCARSILDRQGIKVHPPIFISVNGKMRLIRKHANHLIILILIISVFLLYHSFSVTTKFDEYDLINKHQPIYLYGNCKVHVKYFTTFFFKWVRITNQDVVSDSGIFQLAAIPDK